MGDTNNSGISIYGFIVFGVLIVIAISMINSIISNSTSGYNATNQSSINTYQLTFSQNPTAGQIITMDNTTFEFDNGGGVAQGYVSVRVGNTTTDTVSNLKIALQNYTTYEVS
jgi:hypothetical protein